MQISAGFHLVYVLSCFSFVHEQNERLHPAWYICCCLDGSFVQYVCQGVCFKCKHKAQCIWACMCMCSFPSNQNALSKAQINEQKHRMSFRLCILLQCLSASFPFPQQPKPLRLAKKSQFVSFFCICCVRQQRGCLRILRLVWTQCWSDRLILREIRLSPYTEEMRGSFGIWSKEQAWRSCFGENRQTLTTLLLIWAKYPKKGKKLCNGVYCVHVCSSIATLMQLRLNVFKSVKGWNRKLLVFHKPSSVHIVWNESWRDIQFQSRLKTQQESLVRCSEKRYKDQHWVSKMVCVDIFGMKNKYPEEAVLKIWVSLIYQLQLVSSQQVRLGIFMRCPGLYQYFTDPTWAHLPPKHAVCVDSLQGLRGMPLAASRPSNNCHANFQLHYFPPKSFTAWQECGFYSSNQTSQTKTKKVDWTKSKSITAFSCLLQTKERHYFRKILECQ